MKRDSGMISDLHLEQYVLGELSARDTESVRDALKTDGNLRTRLEEIKRSDGETLSSFPPVRMAPLIEERKRSASASPRRAPFAVFVPLAAAALVVVSVVSVGGIVSRMQGSGQDVTRLKGVERLSIYRKTAEGAELLEDGSLVRRADVLQIAYSAGEAKYGTIFSIDGRGVVTFHLPPDYVGRSQFSPELERQGQTVLPSAYELDDAPAFERFFFVFSRSRFDLKDVQKASSALSADPGKARAGSLRIPSGLSVYSLVLKKQG
jgi:hypothetical protein